MINEKKISVLSILLFIFCLTACGNKKEEDALHLGVNAIITEIDATNQSIAVKDYDIEDDILGSKCIIDCSKVPLIYCDYDTGDVESIDFNDLQPNGEIILSIRSSEIQRRKSMDSVSCEIEVEQIQLGTQRLSIDK